MKPNYHAILEECLELGVASGYDRAHKYDQNPSKDLICMAIEEAVMVEICQRFIFDEK